MIELKVFVKDDAEKREDFKEANEIATLIVRFLSQKHIQERIRQVHVPNANSQEIQRIFEREATDLGFKSEKKGLFKRYQLRPDYYKSLPYKGAGILLEVERGKTLANNTDLLDVWKCHICKEANFLFLIVPQKRQNTKGGDSKIYENVLKRMQAFFEQENYVNVDAIFVFGY